MPASKRVKKIGGEGSDTQPMKPSSASPLHELSDYELQRLERIQRNQQRLKELQLVELGQEMKAEMEQVKAKPVKPASIKGLTRRNSTPVDAPRRSSSRLRGQPAEELALSMSDEGEVLKIGGEVLRLKASAARLALVRQDSGVHSKAYAGRHNPEPELPFSSNAGGHKWQEGTDAELLDLLRRSSGLPTIVPTAASKNATDTAASEGMASQTSNASTENKRSSPLISTPADGDTLTLGGRVATAAPAAADSSTAQTATARRDQSGSLGAPSVDGLEEEGQTLQQRRKALKRKAGAVAAGKEVADEGPLAQLPVGGASVSQILQMSLKEQNVAKVTGDAITHLQFMPTSTHAVLACVDKKGSVGFWNVQGLEDDIILEFKPHDQYICGLKWLGPHGQGGLLTCSYDGSARKLDLVKGCWHLCHSSAEEEYSACEATQDGSTLYLGDVDGGLTVVDTRAPAGSQQAPWALSPKKFNTLHLHPARQHHLLAATSDGGVSVWDLRQLRKGAVPVARGAHNQTCQSAYFCPTGNGLIASTSRDNTVRVWDCSLGSKGASALEEVAVIRHNNDTGRWIVPFRATWGARGDCILVGNMGRAMDVIPLSKSGAGVRVESVVAKHDAELLTAIPSRVAAHPVHHMVAGATGSGRVHVFQ